MEVIFFVKFFKDQISEKHPFTNGCFDYVCGNLVFNKMMIR